VGPSSRPPGLGLSTGEQHDELASIKFWLEAKAAKLNAKLRAPIAAGLNGVCSLFDGPKIREVFAPEPLFKNFKGFDRLIEEGQIVALRVPRLARAEHGSGDVGRGVFFVAESTTGTRPSRATGTSSRSAARPSAARSSRCKPTRVLWPS